jgi:hypothetical protein
MAGSSLFIFGGIHTIYVLADISIVDGSIIVAVFIIIAVEIHCHGISS